MTVIILERVPVGVRGELTRWMLEIHTGCFRRYAIGASTRSLVGSGMPTYARWRGFSGVPDQH